MGYYLYAYIDQLYAAHGGYVAQLKLHDIIITIHEFLVTNPTEFAILKVKGEKSTFEKAGFQEPAKSKSEESARHQTLIYLSNHFRQRTDWFYRKRGM